MPVVERTQRPLALQIGVLLANHGVLVFHRSAELAEEAAQAALNASLIGGPVVVPEDLRAAALQRAMAFAATETRSA